MEKLSDVEDLSVDEKWPAPNLITYTTLINGFTRSGKSDACARSEKIIVRMEERGIIPDTIAYTSMMDCYAKCTGRERIFAAEKALAMLERVENLYMQSKLNEIKPNVATYATCIRAISNSKGSLSAVDMAEGVLRRMDDISNAQMIEGIKPTTTIYNAVIECVGKYYSGGGKGARRAEELLDEMFERYEAGVEEVQPNARTYAAVMLTWTRTNERNEVIAINVQRLLDKFERLFKDGVTTITPNVFCYTICMQAWGKCHRPEKSDFLLSKMRQIYRDTRNESIRPNPISYATVINAYGWSREKGAAFKAQRIMDTIMIKTDDQPDDGNKIDCKPTTIVFNSLLNAYSHSGEWNSGRLAEKVLFQMKYLVDLGYLQSAPDIITYNTVIAAYTNQNDIEGAKGAQKILDQMESEYADGSSRIKPDLLSFNTVIKGWARSGHAQCADRAQMILLKLEKMGGNGETSLKPNGYSYTTTINAAAFTTGSAEERLNAFNIATYCYKGLRDSDHAESNQVTFGTMLKAISKLIPDNLSERDDWAKVVFEESCKLGYVNDFVLREFHQSASPSLCRQLLPNYTFGKISIKSLPDEWSKKVIRNRY
jgi:pentatricopeptide repeat protein